jgi:hypothetical protein
MLHRKRGLDGTCALGQIRERHATLPSGIDEALRLEAVYLSAPTPRGACEGFGFDEQIFGADKQVSARAKRLRSGMNGPPLSGGRRVMTVLGIS